MSLVHFMDRKEITRRDLKIESVRGYNQANDDFVRFTEFPVCEDCNPTGRGIVEIIPNTNPVKEVIFIEFPKCENCNKDHDGIFFEREV